VRNANLRLWMQLLRQKVQQTCFSIYTWGQHSLLKMCKQRCAQTHFRFCDRIKQWLWVYKNRIPCQRVLRGWLTHSLNLRSQEVLPKQIRRRRMSLRGESEATDVAISWVQSMIRKHTINLQSSHQVVCSNLFCAVIALNSSLNLRDFESLSLLRFLRSGWRRECYANYNGS